MKSLVMKSLVEPSSKLDTADAGPGGSEASKIVNTSAFVMVYRHNSNLFVFESVLGRVTVGEISVAASSKTVSLEHVVMKESG